MKLKNDVSFNVNNRIIVFCEHQSTLNGNMPLRDLSYIAKTYEQMVPVRERYKKHTVKLPKPAFFSAITYCIENHILEEYLSRKGSEVMNFLCAEYDYEMDLQVKGEETYEDGFEDGKEFGLKHGMESLISDNLLENRPKEIIIKKLIKHFSLSEENAKKH